MTRIAATGKFVDTDPPLTFVEREAGRVEKLPRKELADRARGLVIEEQRLLTHLTNLKNPIEELQVLIHLLDHARATTKDDLMSLHFGMLDRANQVVFRRLRALADRCADDIDHWDNPQRESELVELREAHEDDAPQC